MTDNSSDPGKDAHDMGQLPIPGLFDGFAALDVATRRVRFAGVMGTSWNEGSFSRHDHQKLPRPAIWAGKSHDCRPGPG